VQPSQSANGNRIEVIQLKRAFPYKRLESADCHLIQPSLHLSEPRRTIVADVCSPSQECSLAEDEVGPGNDRKEVTT
jgi:hypothetical protein